MRGGTQIAKFTRQVCYSACKFSSWSLQP